MVQQVDFGVVVERWVRRRSSDDGDDPPFTLDVDGFLPRPGGLEAEWLRPSEASCHGAWVLLGEPGSGKTTTFKQHSLDHDQDDPPLPGEPGTIWVTGSELADARSTQEVVGVYLDALPSSSDGDGDVVLIIDQLDESPFLHQFPKWLKHKLAMRNTQRLRIWIACRTAEYRHELTRILEHALKSCVVGDLAPLTREDAEELVASVGAGASSFLNTVVANAAGVLASVPLTLKVLLSASAADPAVLQTGPKRLFEQGLAVLADEHDDDRNPAQVTTTREQRLAIATRIAAHLLLSGRRTIYTGFVGDQSDQAVPVGAVIGDEESAGAGTFEVAKPRVSETLATALFSRTTRNTAMFAHSSFAAFLTARYLAARLTAPAPMPTPQLSGLFLVSAPDEDTAAIPEHLRETAAWLMAHAPAQTRWLAIADPEGLVSHSATITDPEVRALLVEGLLLRADRIELTDRSWQRARWHLSHPGLADQLNAALTTEPGNPGDGWTGLARVRLAVRLAQDSGLAELAEPLLAIAETDTWPVALRQSAAKAAMSASSAAAAPRLVALLATLTPDQVDVTGSEQPAWDNVSELVGTLLQILWPQHLPFAAALPHIRPVTTRDFIGMHLIQVRTFPLDVAEQDLPALLSHTEHTLHAHGIGLHQPDHPADNQSDEADLTTASLDLFALSSDRVRSLRDFVAPIVDRVLASEQPHQYLPRIARILLRFLRSPDRIPLPTAVDLHVPDGGEPPHTTALRRELAEELIRAAPASSGPSHDDWISTAVLSRWGQHLPKVGEVLPSGTERANRTQLLDADDAQWAAGRAQHYGVDAPELAETFERLALALTPSGNDTALTNTSAEEQEPAWQQADTFAAAQRKRLNRAVAGNSDSYWQLVKDLTVNPVTGQYEFVTSWDVSIYPGAALWPADELRDQLRLASQRYLATEHDHHQEWLGTNASDWRAYAGYAALATLHAADNDTELGLTTVPDDRWAGWVGAILAFSDHFGAVPDLAHDLANLAAQHAPTQLVTAVGQFVRTHLTYATHSVVLPGFPSQLTPILTSLAEKLRATLCGTSPDTAPDAPLPKPSIATGGPLVVSTHARVYEAALLTWSNLLRQPLRFGDPEAIDLAKQTIASHLAELANDIDLKLATAAGATLLAADAAQHWPTIRQAVTTSEQFARNLAIACASSEDTVPILEVLDEAELADLYRWLTIAFPPETDTYQTGFNWVSPERRVHDWRREILSNLSAHGSPEAVHQLRALADAYPAELNVQAALLDARQAAQAAAVGHLTSDEVTALLNNHSRRVVRTAAQLAEVVTETLDSIADDLPTHGNLLWDCERIRNAPKGTPSERWRPKPEGALGAYLAHELKLRLENNRIVVNREVMVRPTDTGDSGERPDIVIDAHTPDDRTAEAPIISIPLEIKGSWHDAVLTAQDTQLAQRYLTHMNTTAGIYVVGWYPLDQWNVLVAHDRRKTNAGKLGSSTELRSSLQHQASEIQHATARKTYPYVLTVPRATPAQ